MSLIRKIGIFFVLFVVCVSLFGCTQKPQIHGNSNPKMNIVYADLEGFSAEGGMIKAIYEDDNLLFFVAQIYSEMGNQQIEYCIFDNMIKINIVKTYYSEPFYVNPNHITIDHTEHVNYIKMEDTLYNFNVSNEELIPLSVEEKNRVESEMDTFISIIKENKE